MNQDAEKIVKRMVEACSKAGLAVDVLEPSSAIKINAPDGNAHMAEMVTLRLDADGKLMWWWSWGKPICAAQQVEHAVELISKVVSVRVF